MALMLPAVPGAGPALPQIPLNDPKAEWVVLPAVLGADTRAGVGPGAWGSA